MFNNEETFISFQTELDKYDFKLKTCDSEVTECSRLSPCVVPSTRSLVISDGPSRKSSEPTLKAPATGLSFPLCSQVYSRNI